MLQCYICRTVTLGAAELVVVTQEPAKISGALEASAPEKFTLF